VAALDPLAVQAHALAHAVVAAGRGGRRRRLVAATVVMAPVRRRLGLFGLVAAAQVMTAAAVMAAGLGRFDPAMAAMVAAMMGGRGRRRRGVVAMVMDARFSDARQREGRGRDADGKGAKKALHAKQLRGARPNPPSAPILDHP
jgi:hypothetical protein